MKLPDRQPEAAGNVLRDDTVRHVVVFLVIGAIAGWFASWNPARKFFLGWSGKVVWKGTFQDAGIVEVVLSGRILRNTSRARPSSNRAEFRMKPKVLKSARSTRRRSRRTRGRSWYADCWSTSTSARPPTGWSARSASAPATTHAAPSLHALRRPSRTRRSKRSGARCGRRSCDWWRGSKSRSRGIGSTRRSCGWRRRWSTC